MRQVQAKCSKAGLLPVKSGPYLSLFYDSASMSHRIGGSVLCVSSHVTAHTLSSISPSHQRPLTRSSDISQSRKRTALFPILFILISIFALHAEAEESLKEEDSNTRLRRRQVPKDSQLVQLQTFCCRWKRADFGRILDASNSGITTLRKWVIGISNHVGDIGLIQIEFNNEFFGFGGNLWEYKPQGHTELDYRVRPFCETDLILKALIEKCESLLNNEKAITIDGNIVNVQGKMNYDGKYVKLYVVLPVGRHTLKVTSKDGWKYCREFEVSQPRVIYQIADYPGLKDPINTADISIFFSIGSNLESCHVSLDDPVEEADTLRWHVGLVDHAPLPDCDIFEFGKKRFPRSSWEVKLPVLSKEYGEYVRLLTPLEFIELARVHSLEMLRRGCKPDEIEKFLSGREDEDEEF